MDVPSPKARTDIDLAAPRQAGRVINFRYEILDDGAVGSRFYAYKARDRVLNRLACVKLLRPELSADPMLVEAIMSEAQSTINLSHPGVARVFECGKDGDDYFIVTEWVRGASLADRLARSPKLTNAEAVDVGISIAETLEHSHKNGFIHGDLRVENVLVTQEGDIKVADFGIGPPAIRALSPDSPDLLRIARTLSPEAVRGTELAAGSDIYQFGIMMYRMVAGRYPFEGANAQDVALRRLDTPPPRIGLAEVPRTLEGLILKCLQVDPRDRYHTVTELVEDLRLVRNGLRQGRSLDWSPLDEEDDAVGKGAAGAARGVNRRAKGMSPLLKPFVWAISIVFALAAVIAIVFLIMTLTFPGEVAVPNLVGKTVDEALPLLQQAKLTVGKKSEEPSMDKAEGVIVSQNPVAGFDVKRGRAIDLVVSTGAPPVPVPNVVGMTEDAARSALQKVGLRMGKVSSENDDTVRKGRVISQAPEADFEAKRGESVDLVVSGGKEEDASVNTPYMPGEGNPAEVHWVEVQLTLKDSPPQQRIRMVVDDALGTSTVYDKIHDAGDTIHESIEVRGQYQLQVYGGEDGDTLLQSYIPTPGAG